MDIEMFGKLSDAFGPSGFEEDVIRTIADYCKEFDVEYPGQRMPWHYHAWRLSSDQPSGTCGMDPHQIRKNGTWYYLCKTGSFHDNSGTQQSDSGN